MKSNTIVNESTSFGSYLNLQGVSIGNLGLISDTYVYGHRRHEYSVVFEAFDTSNYVGKVAGMYPLLWRIRRFQYRKILPTISRDVI